MPDRVPIGTHPGMVSALVGTDQVVGAFTSLQTVNALFLRRNPLGGTGATVHLRNASGGGGDGIVATFGAGAETATGAGPITGTTFYLRVVSSDPDGENLSGWFELADAVVIPFVGPMLTTRDRVKMLLEATAVDAARDALLDLIIIGVSERIQRTIGRTIVASSIVGEVHSGRGLPTLLLQRRPIRAVAAVRIEGTAIASTDYAIDAQAGILDRVATNDLYELSEWDEGFRNISVDYNAGYDFVPEDLALAATLQSAYVYGKRGSRVGDRGQVLDPGGSAQYLTGPWAPGVLETLACWREVKFG